VLCKWFFTNSGELDKELLLADEYQIKPWNVAFAMLVKRRGEQ
jgi:hypothetical protein